MKSTSKSTLFAAAFFVLATLLMTYPLVSRMGTGVRDLGDPLLNTWILDSNVHKIGHLNFKGYFNTNIFYPFQHTLAYSEHLFTQSLFALPISFFSHNPVFVYNFVLLISFITSCLGMYFLARYLTQSSSAGVVAGIIYGFAPFMFAHLSHLQILAAGGIPLAFLFLHKFFKSASWKDLLFFILFYTLQVLANGYYALYLTLFAGLYFLFYFFLKRRYKDRRFWLKAGAALIILLACIGPFYSHYIQVNKEMGFSRTIGSFAELKSFLSTPLMNKIYGRLTLPFWKPEGELFPGLLAVVLAGAGCWLSLKKRNKEKLFIDKPVPVYLTILVFSFLFTFGPKGPYIFLYKYVPGFRGLRVASRFHILVMFSLAVLAAFGVKEILKRISISPKKTHLIMIPLVLILLLEYMNFPVPYDNVPSENNIPEVYIWLAQKENIKNIIELPLPKTDEGIASVECLRIYYSIFHRKNMVNGYSGFFPPLYNELRRRWQTLNLDQNIEDLETLGVDHILIHGDEYSKDELDSLISGLAVREARVQLVDKINMSYVFRLLSPHKLILADTEVTSSLPLQDWTVQASINKEMAAKAVDGDIRTRWESGPQKKGTFFELDLGSIFSVSGVSLKLGDKPKDFPRGYRVEISRDGTSWKTVQEMKTTDLPITAYLKPKELSLDVHFPRSEARYFRFINTGEHDIYYWSIFEIDIFD